MDSAYSILGIHVRNQGGHFMSKNKKNSLNEEKGMLQKDDDLRKKGRIDHSVNPPWPVNDPKGKSGAADRGHRNRP